jgi:hypothetical protein
VSEPSFIVQKLEWFQLRAENGEATLVLIASLPNGFFTAVPCDVAIQNADHSLIGLGPSVEEALAQVQKNIAGKTREELFPKPA